MAGLWFEEFEVGRVFDHPLRRTVTETDNLLMSALTHNPAPLHLDAEYMKGTEYGQILVNSCFTLGLMVGISVNDTTQGTAVANLGWDEVRFPAPIFVGDTLRIEVEVQKIRRGLGIGAGTATVNGDLACKGDIMFALVDLPDALKQK